LIAVAVFALVIGASAYAIPALAQPFWADEADAPPGLEGEEHGRVHGAEGRLRQPLG